MHGQALNVQFVFYNQWLMLVSMYGMVIIINVYHTILNINQSPHIKRIQI